MHSPASTLDDFCYDHVVVVGVGLIGGSIAKALKARGLARKITGLGRNRTRLLAAQEAGVIDEAAVTVDEVAAFSLAIVCTPVDRIPEDVRALQAMNQPRAVITDAGSVKGRICRELISTPTGVTPFIGSHPMAGSERGGWEHADADLFRGRICAITPQGHDEITISTVEQFWSSIGMHTVRYHPDQHDQIVALTSHMPHVAASAMASLLTAEAWPLAATGFRDTTRVAGGDPELWTSILMENRQAVSSRVKELVEVLQQFAGALDQSEANAIVTLLSRGQIAREQWIQSMTSSKLEH